MQRIRRLRNPIQDYAWGSHDALAAWMGRPHPTPSPEAELWMGAHPSAPSAVETEAGPVSLPDWIARDPTSALGAELVQRFGGELPFLLKVLAPAQALSLQTHPDAERARAGFARENAAGLALDDPRRSYRDANPKPELICALGEFTALCGFRRAAEIEAGLGALGLDALVAELAGGLESFFRRLLERPEAERRALAERVAAAAAPRAERSPECAEVVELARLHPGDVGVLAPLLLNLVRLAPGEALFLPAGNLHAYLRGLGVELMASSDNVLRGGLTEKHVDVPELLATLRFREGPPEVLRPDARGAYATPARAFRLDVTCVARDAPLAVPEDHGVEILLCSEGGVRVTESGGDLELGPGQALWVPAAAPAYAVEGQGVVHRAGVPR